MADHYSYTLYYQSSSHGGIRLTKEQADEVTQVMEQVASTGRTVVWQMTVLNEHFELTQRFLIGPHIPVRVDVERRPDRR